MTSIYLTLQEAAELECESYHTFYRKLKRDQNSYILKSKPSQSGGKDRVLICLKSLSPAAQRKYKAAHPKKEIQGSDLVIQEIDKRTETPWYLDTDISWYIEQNKTAYYKAVELAGYIQDILDHDGGSQTDYTYQVADQLGMSGRTLYRKVEAYKEAAAWALKLQQEDGANYDFYKILSLCRKPKGSGNFPSIIPEIKQVIKNIWFDREFAQNRGTKDMLYSRLQLIQLETGWKIPSYPSVCRYITHLMENEKMSSAHYLAANGTRSWKNQGMIKALRDTSGLQVMEVVMGDEHTFDCWVSYRTPNGKNVPIRPKLVAWIDVRSRMVMGDVICRDANADIIKESIIKMMYAEHGGVPKILYIDNGKDYTAKEMTGVSRKERYPGFESTTFGFYQAVGIEQMHRAKPYEPWSKTQIERLFRSVIHGFSKWMKSYTGTLTGSKTSDKVPKDIKHMFEQGKLMTMEEFYGVWSAWLHEYHKKPHRGLKDMQETYITPLSLFEQGERYEKPVPPKSFSLMLLMEADEARVYNYGIKRFGYVYTAEELANYIGQTVRIKYDKADVTRLYVFGEDGSQICEALSQELLQIAPSVPQEALEEHVKAQKRQLKKVREQLAEASRPLDERIAGAAQANRIVGSMMLEGQGRTGKVVALPTVANQEYKETVKHKSSKKAAAYLSDMGEEAISKLKHMG